MSTVQPNWYRYLLSLAAELRLQASRVRDLIGDSHWLSDGHHKEYLLLSLLQRHLPAGMIASRGFVISPTDDDMRSKEQDILIVDTLQESPVFNQGGLVISFPRQVRAAISVKSTMKSDSIDDSVVGLNSVRKLALTDEDHRNIWCGAYFFVASENIATDPSLALDNLGTSMNRHRNSAARCVDNARQPYGLHLFATADNLAIQVRYRQGVEAEQVGEDFLTGFETEGLATAVFLADLLDHLSSTRGNHDIDFSLFAEHASFTRLSEPLIVK